MNKTSLSPSHILLRTVFIFAVCALTVLPSAQTVQADGAPPPQPDMGGVAPYQPIETNVQMMSETVLIDLLPYPTRWTGQGQPPLDYKQIKVRASFTLRNQGAAEEKMQVIFPLSRLDYPWLGSSYNIIESSFVASVNGETVPTTRVSTPPELQAVANYDGELPDGFFVPDVSWAGFDVTFPVQEDVIVQVQYLMWGYVEESLYRVDYILETGAGWYGRILSADIILRLPYPATSESVLLAPPGCVLSGNEVQCRMENFEPKRKDNLSFGFIDTNVWSPTLELRARVEQYPEDGEAWYQLGGMYERLGFWRMMEGSASIINQDMADLSVEAFGKAVASRHDWGDAHLALARVLWLNGKGKRTAEDPLVQQVLLEMQLAASHGISVEDYFYNSLAADIRRALPDLEPSLLPVPILLTPEPPLPAPTAAPIPAAVQKVTALAVGSYHTCVLTAEEIKCQGLDLATRVVDKAKQVVAGDYFTCILMMNGGIKCMGENTFGQLGDGTTTSRATPVDVVGLTAGVSALVAGDNHTCALMTGGGVKCWGRNFFGQLGDGTLAYSLAPVDVVGLTNGVATLVAGSDHTCAFMQTGGIKCWGANESGQLGDGSLVNRLEPVDITMLPADTTALAAGFAHTCALDSQGQVLCWGDNSHRQLGSEDTTVHTAPVTVPGLDGNVLKIAAGHGYTCALTRQGGVKCWGRNGGRNDRYNNQLGDYTETERSTPGDVPGLTSGAIDIQAGNVHTCVLLQNGKVRCWGATEFAYNGTEADYGIQYAPTPTPVMIPQLPAYTPVPLPTAAPAETSSPMTDLVWDLVLLIGVGVLVLLLRRAKAKAKG